MRRHLTAAAFAALAAPALLAAPAWAEVEIQEVTSPGGIEAWLVEERSIPIVSVEILFEGGSALEDPDAQGAINLMTATLEEGAAEMDAQAFAEAREAIAAQISYDVYSDALTVSATFLSETAGEAAELVRASLVEPRFDEAAVDRVRAQVLAGLRSSAQDPSEIAGRAMAEMAWGDHPYGRDQDGTIESVTALTRADVVDAWRRAIPGAGVHVAAVGDIDAEELGRLLDTMLGDLPAPGATRPEAAEPLLTGQVEVIDFDSPQSVVVFAQPGIEREDDDFFAAYLLDHIVGGSGFTARLYRDVREERGLTYGIYTGLASRDLGQTWRGQAQTANETAAEVIERVRAQWAALDEGNVTAEELGAAKTYLKGAYPLRFDGNGRIAGILASMQFQDLAPDYIATRNGRVDAVTLDQINRVARELADPEALSFVVVGRPEGVEAEGGTGG